MRRQVVSRCDARDATTHYDHVRRYCCGFHTAIRPAHSMSVVVGSILQLGQLTRCLSLLVHSTNTANMRRNQREEIH